MPSTPEATANLVAAFEQGIREQGYVQGKDIAVEQRYAGTQPERIIAATDELLHAGVRVIVTTTDEVVRTVAARARGVPIVMVNTNDPVGAGLVKTLAQPGGYVTGLTNFSREIGAKRVELLKECVPTISRLVYLWNSKLAGAAEDLERIDGACRRVQIRFEASEVREAADIEPAFAGLSGSRETALLVQAPNPMFYTQRATIARLATTKGVPSMFNRAEYVTAGGFMSYGPNVAQMFRRAAFYVDRILRGARPADLAVEQPSQFELTLNLQTARALGIEVPASVLGRAGTVIR